MIEFFKINGTDVGFENHPTKGTHFLPGALDSLVEIRKGKIKINLLTPNLELTDQLHNGLLSDDYYADKKQIDYLRFCTYSDMEVPNAEYGSVIHCTKSKTANSGIQVYEFPREVYFEGNILVQKGWIKIEGHLVSHDDEEQTLPIEIVKCFEPKTLLPNRKSFSLDEAKKQDPLTVYNLVIKKGVFNEFPKEILGFKNLESLSFYQVAQINFQAFPDELVDLTSLHTFKVNTHSNITELPKSIGNWENMEDFTLWGKLTAIPKSIKDWKNIRSIDLAYNELKSIPEWLCQLPTLKSLDITQNSFETLPEALKGIQNLKLEFSKRRLFEDFTYLSKNTKEVDESLFDFTDYEELKSILSEEIDAIEELKLFKDFFIKESRPSIQVNAKIVPNLPIGSSKFGGLPDLPSSINYPTEKGKYYIFHAQINLKDIAHLQAYLPEKGMLYFFVNTEEYAEKPKIFYHPNTDDLQPFVLPQEACFIDDNYEMRKEYALNYSQNIALPDTFDIWKKLDGKWSTYKNLLESDESTEILNDFGHILSENINAHFLPKVKKSFILKDQFPKGEHLDKALTSEYELEFGKNKIHFKTILNQQVSEYDFAIIEKSEYQTIAQHQSFGLVQTMVINNPVTSFDKKSFTIAYQDAYHITSRIFEEVFVDTPLEEKTFHNALAMGNYPFSQQEGIESFAVTQHRGEEKDWFTLLSVDSFNVPDVCIWDAGTLSYAIHKKDLEILDFSKVVSRIESC
ncbi:MAG: DUF1963 domain-containing protein [Flavobacteriales bacterium]